MNSIVTCLLRKLHDVLQGSLQEGKLAKNVLSHYVTEQLLKFKDTWLYRVNLSGNSEDIKLWKYVFEFL